MREFIYLLLIPLLASCKPATVDSKGGLRITVNPDSEILEDISEDVEVLKGRVAKACKNNPVVKLDAETNNIVIELPKEIDTDMYKELILSNGNFRIYEVYDNADLSGAFIELNKVLLDNNCYGLIDTTYRDSIEQAYPFFMLFYPAYSSNAEPIPGGALGYSNPEDTAIVNQILSKSEIRSIFPEDVKFYWSYFSFNNRFSGNDEIYTLYATQEPTDYVAITTNMIESAKSEIYEVTADFQVRMQFKSEYCDTWAHLTRSNIGKCLAIVFDGSVYSCPMVQSEITGGAASISGSFSQEEAKALAAIMQGGELKTKLSIIKVEHVEK